MVIVQKKKTFQEECKLQNHLQKHNVEDMVNILRNDENVQRVILGFTDLTLNQWI